MERLTRDSICVEIVHSDLPRLLEAVTVSGITMRGVCILDALTVRLSVERRFWRQLQCIIRRSDAKVRILGKTGPYWRIKAVLSRPILLVGVSIFLLLTAMLPQHILVITVEGNRYVPEKQIIEAAQMAGITFGASRRDIRSERVKNRLLEMLPQLQWVGINTRGCTATISVKERGIEETSKTPSQFGSVVASRDGVIQWANATKGNLLCIPGQAVKAGELLISGYTDCGLTIRVTGAEGEVYAETLRNLEGVIPLTAVEQGVSGGKIKKYSLIIGKKRIKFYKDSGICSATCDKMYKEYCMTLPGGIVLPFAVAVEEWQVYDECLVSTSQFSVRESIQQSACTYLIQDMVAGKILSAVVSTECEGDICRVKGFYRCLEMIGRLKHEENFERYGKSD